MNVQRGSSLIVSLVILTAITLGSVIAMQRSTLQLRMVGNLQHQQMLFNATYGDLNTLFEGLRTLTVANRVLNQAIQAENANPGSTINPYNDADLTKPSVGSGIDSPTTSLSLTELPSDKPNSLKNTEGSSAGTLAPYYFAATATTTDTGKLSSSRQEIGFYYLAPAPN